MADLDPAAVMQRSRETIAAADKTLASLRERPRGEGAWDPPPPVSRAPASPQRPVEGRNWASEQRWVEQIIDQRLKGAFADGVGAALGTVRAQLRQEIAGLQNRIKEQEARIAGLESTVTDLLAALERRVEGLEQSARPGPRLREVS